ncbi:MAG TPA: PKD domain-containing protein [Gemmataceae bacterium]|nr:PKD domain-containing protein [Gemmataceae bacterium]
MTFSLGSTAVQAVPGGSVKALDPADLEGVVGTPYADSLTGNSADNTLVGAGGADSIAGGPGNDLIQAGVTQVVYLDFDSDTAGSDRAYTQTDRDAVHARLEANYGLFGFRFTQARPAAGPYTTVFFNKTPYFVNGIAQPGGIADEVDWRNLNLGGTVSIDVNAFLGYSTRGQVAPTVANWVALSATVAAHELGHLVGLRHFDSFGPVGSGVYGPAVAAGFLPAYPGPTAAVDTPLHVMSSPASTRSDLLAATGDTFFGVREAVKLAFSDTGRVTPEATAFHGDRDHAQPLVLNDLTVPNTVRAGTEAGFALSVQAAAVIGAIDRPALGPSENDWYSFSAAAGEVMTIELLSRTLARASNGIDSVLRVFSAAGLPVSYYGWPAEADDTSENQDALILDLRIPADGTYYVEVDTYFDVTVPDEDVGQYELFLYKARLVATPEEASASGDVLFSQPGDTVIASSGSDRLLAEGGAAVPGKLVAAPAQSAAGTNQAAFERVARSFLLGSFADAADSGPWQVSVNWGDQTPATRFTQGASGPLTAQPHTYAQDGKYTVTVKVTNAAGLSSGKTFQVVVANSAPTFEVAPADQPAVTGVSTAFALGSFADAALDNAWTVRVDWGDGSGSVAQQMAAGEIPALAHTYAASGAYTATLTVTDKDGGSRSDQFVVTVVGDAPTVPVAGTGSVTEGSAYTIVLGGVAPAAVTVAGYTIHWGDGTSAETFAGSPAGRTHVHTYADGPTDGTVTVDLVADGVTFPGAGIHNVSVVDVLPTVGLAGDPSAAKGTAYTLTLGAVTDPGRDTVIVYTVYWGDGTSDTYATPGPKTHVYGHDGQLTAARTITVDVADEDGTHRAAGTKTITVHAVAPVISAVSSDGPVFEGSPVRVTIAAVDAVDPAGALAYEFDFDDDGGFEVGPQAANAAARTYPDDGIRTVRVRVTDADGAVSVGTTTVTVRNAPPVPTIDAVSGPWLEGTVISAIGSATDAAGPADTVTLSWAVYRDGAAGPSAVGSGGAFAFIPPDDGNYRIVLTTADEDGGSARAVRTVTVGNVPVAFDAGGDLDLPSAALGSFTRTITFTDPGADSWSGTVDYGDLTGVRPLVIDPAAMRFTLAHRYAAEGTYTVRVALADDGAPVVRTFAVTVHLNAAPVADAGADQTVPEGTSVTLQGTFIDPDPGDTHTFLWHAESTNGQVVADGTGQTFAFTPADAGTYTVSFTVTDSHGNSGSDTVTVTATDVGPTATITGPTDGVRGQERRFTLSAVDPSPIDQEAGFTYRIDWGDGTTTTVPPNRPPAANHAFTETGTYVVRVTATDRNGVAGPAAVHTVVIETVAVQPDVHDPGLTMLVAGGTPGDDRIAFQKSGLAVKLTINGTTYGPYSPTAGLTAFGQAGNDEISVGNATLAGWLYGDAGADTLTGGGQADLLLGGAGADVITGGAGRDVVIGGPGADAVFAGGGEDLMVDGTTSFDGDPEALSLVMDEWTSMRNFTQRARNLRGEPNATFTDRLNGTVFLRAGLGTTVFADADRDDLNGQDGNSWSFAELDGPNPDRYDAATGDVVEDADAMGTVRTGPVAAYDFDAGTGPVLTDISGNGHDGSISGAAWTAAGRTGGALLFDGVDDWVTIADAAGLDLTTGMTLEAWVRPASAAGWDTILLKEGAGTSAGRAYALYGNDPTVNRPAAFVNTGGADVSAAGTARLGVNSWAHLAATYDGITLRLYVNGVEVRSKAVAGPLRQTAGPLRIGGNAVWGEFFSGLIDDVRVYDRPLTSAEINQDAATPVAPSGGPTRFFVADGATGAGYRYDPAGAAAGSFGPHAAGTALMGIASNAAGTTVWVIDGVNHTVTVKGPAGTVVGTWQAQGLSDPQGITTDQRDVWVVDAGLDQVVRFAGAASRTAGTQAPDSAFALHPDNGSPSDVVTNGLRLWVTDDARDEVFVYAPGGQLVGRWQLDPRNADPSGVTLDPTAWDALWVLDRADKAVYRYTGGAFRRSGAATADSVFGLAAGNTSPEGLADPPVAARPVTVTGRLAITDLDPRRTAPPAAPAARPDRLRPRPAAAIPSGPRVNEAIGRQPTAVQGDDRLSAEIFRVVGRAAVRPDWEGRTASTGRPDRAAVARVPGAHRDDVPVGDNGGASAGTAFGTDRRSANGYADIGVWKDPPAPSTAAEADHHDRPRD